MDVGLVVFVESEQRLMRYWGEVLNMIFLLCSNLCNTEKITLHVLLKNGQNQ